MDLLGACEESSSGKAASCFIFLSLADLAADYATSCIFVSLEFTERASERVSE